MTRHIAADQDGTDDPQSNVQIRFEELKEAGKINKGDTIIYKSKRQEETPFWVIEENGTLSIDPVNKHAYDSFSPKSSPKHKKQKRTEHRENSHSSSSRKRESAMKDILDHEGGRRRRTRRRRRSSKRKRSGKRRSGRRRR